MARSTPLQTAFEQAKALVEARMAEVAANPTTLPWLTDELERTRRLLGDDFWPYGIEPNRTTIEVFLRYAHEQGLIGRRLTPDELFVPETLERYLV